MSTDLLKDAARSVRRVRRERESQKTEDQKRERERESKRRKKMRASEKVTNSRNTLLFQCLAAPGNQTVGSLKRRVRSHLARQMVKKCQNASCLNDLEANSAKH